MQKIGILGSGDVGQSLGRGLAAIGHNVMIGSRQPESEHLVAWKQSVGRRASTGSTTDAASYGDILIVAVNWSGMEDVLHDARPEAAGKIVIDVSNPLDFSGTTDPTLAVGHNMSGGEVVQQLLPDSSVVKTLNIVNHLHMCQPTYYQGTPCMFYCGNNPAAKAQVAKILDALGWKDTTDLGGIQQSRLLEPLCLLWVTYGMVHNTWDHAFGILRQ
ncbi:DNA-binding protein [Candidatus Saccharibacteria bacterium]|nr:MAG: DNA-binding protein [Candidatus Saccharibacteria bacterium]